MINILPTRTIATFALMTAMLGPAYAVVDQDNPIQPNYLTIQPNSDERWQQEIVVGISGKLDAVELFYSQGAPWLGDELRFVFSVNRGAGWQTDANDYSANIITNTTSTIIDVSSANLMFQSGERFTLGIGRATGATLCCSLYATVNNYTGNFWSYYSNDIHSLQADLAFRTYVSAVPGPAPWLTLLGGLFLGSVTCRIWRMSTTSIDAKGAP